MRTSTFTVRGVKFELAEDDALKLINEIRERFGWIGTTILPEDVEEWTGEPVSPDDWVRLEQGLADDVVRLVQGY